MKKYILFLFVFTSVVYSQSTGWTLPTTVDGSSGDVAFINTNNAKDACNTTYATGLWVGGGDGAGRLTGSNYGFTIPSNAIIDSVNCRFKAKTDVVASGQLTILSLDWNGTHVEEFELNQGLTTTNTFYYINKASGDYTVPFTVSELNDAIFLASYRFDANEAATTISVDCITVNVIYHIAGRNKRILE